jgi:hypothetical protein
LGLPHRRFGLDFPLQFAAFLASEGDGGWNMSTKREAGGQSVAESTSDPAGHFAFTRFILGLCLPGEVAMRLAGLGNVVVRPQLLHRMSGMAALEGGRSAGEVVALECSGQPGLLAVESRLAAGLVNGVLGLEMPPIAGLLSRIERGVLEGVLATLLAQCGLAPGIRLRDRAIETAPAVPFVMAFSVDVRGETCHAWLAASEEFLRSAWANRAPSPTVVPWLEMAATTVSKTEMAGACLGDRVVFDETAALAPDEAWPVFVRWGENVVRARWLPDGLVLPEEGCPRVSTGEVSTRSDRRGSSPFAPVTAPGVAQAEITACVICPAIDATGRTPLVVPRGEPVLLKAGDQRWASGDIAQLDGSFAVRITRKLAG